MAELMPDQAAGLRRMFSRSLVRTITVASGKAGVGRSVLAANLACALARRGVNVCVLDQNRSGRGVAQQLGVEVQHDLADVVRRDRALEDVVMVGPEGIRFVSAPEAVRLLGELPAEEEQRLVKAFGALQPPIDLMLVDAPAADENAATCYTLASNEVIMLVSGEADSITEAYALIKRLAWDFARRRFHVLINRARSEEQAVAIFQNIESTAQRFLSVKVEWLGWVPNDESLRKASRVRQSVVTAFPQSPAAERFRAAADAVMHWPYAGEDCLDGFVQRLVQASRIATLSTTSH